MQGLSVSSSIGRLLPPLACRVAIGIDAFTMTTLTWRFEIATH